MLKKHLWSACVLTCLELLTEESPWCKLISTGDTAQARWSGSLWSHAFIWIHTRHCLHSVAKTKKHHFHGEAPDTSCIRVVWSLSLGSVCLWLGPFQNLIQTSSGFETERDLENHCSLVGKSLSQVFVVAWNAMLCCLVSWRNECCDW